MYAIVKVGGAQYRVSEGERVRVEHLPAAVGEQIQLDKVLVLADGENIALGQPTVAGARVSATVVEQHKGKKIIVFHYRPGAKHQRVKGGHRQNYTWLRVDEIVGA
ncbi:MAG: 50S ribosomal protein L21 [Thermoflexales bacterium]|nr:50S ribosomal protein L21 [Thermoflexales bacterium]